VSDERPNVGTCPTCGMRMVPVLDLPPCGHDAQPSIAPLDEPGIVYSWTRLWSSAEASQLMVMADFFDGGLRITAPLMGADAVAIGDAVHAVVGNETPVVLVAVR
jgi:uncharacterized OB-fold protein